MSKHLMSPPRALDKASPELTSYVKLEGLIRCRRQVWQLNWANRIQIMSPLLLGILFGYPEPDSGLSHPAPPGRGCSIPQNPIIAERFIVVLLQFTCLRSSQYAESERVYSVELGSNICSSGVS